MFKLNNEALVFIGEKIYDLDENKFTEILNSYNSCMCGGDCSGMCEGDCAGSAM